ncbi:ABC transporter permease [Pengzhenrongella frigida]|uniref:ABC transporter permease n=1 Tax=Pengzhenrongella frigida TaxID=1259133 RepID=A0A4Q5N0P4_9MICO|nr:ABC transporter permease [Cellulomonas sp. HLT2-17]RYV50793.1 ABC transporter permease [Cellulomonas sp. HLT2-17]
MLSFLLRRIGSGLALIVVIASLMFVLMNMTGQNVARNIAGQTASEEQVAAKSAELGLDQPVVTRYLDWIGSAIQGDLGSSWFTGQPVTDTIGAKLPVTLSILLVGLLVGTIFSVIIGVAAAVKGGWVDRAVQLLAIIGFALPSFLIALVLAAIFAVKLQIFPAVGYVELAESFSGWAKSITLPAIALAIGAIAATAQQVRGSMIDVLKMDYVRTLRSRGLSARSLLFRHALRNAAPPALTVLSLQFIGLVGGAVVVEKVFGLYGIGTLVFSSSSSGDQPLVLGVVVVMVLIIVLVNLLMDVAYGWLNPKVRV